MTAKRFISEDNCCGYYTEIIDNEKELDLSLFNPKKNLTIEELVNLLNELYEENRELQRHLDVMRSGALTDDKRIKELYNENEQLKQRNNRLEEKIQRERTSFTKTHERWSKEAENKIKELSEENEQLKSEINMLKITIGRNEAFIKRITFNGEWSNTSMK